MDRRLRELIALTALSAVLCGIAFATDYYLTTAAFAALTCTIGVLAVALSWS
jgi:hypothetical protein